MKIAVPGIPDRFFERGDIPMTKEEVRILALVKARIGFTDIIVDVGAGTGSVSVEAALLAQAGRVFAIEREEEGVRLIRQNADKFGVPNIEVRHGCAPEAMTGLPDADVVFVGGSGGALSEILEETDRLLRPGGRMVVTAVTVETLHNTLQTMEAKGGYEVEATGAQITRLRQAGGKNMFQALNPVYIITCTKGGNNER